MQTIFTKYNWKMHVSNIFWQNMNMVCVSDQQTHAKTQNFYLQKNIVNSP